MHKQVERGVDQIKAMKGGALDSKHTWTSIALGNNCDGGLYFFVLLFLLWHHAFVCTAYYTVYAQDNLIIVYDGHFEVKVPLQEVNSKLVLVLEEIVQKERCI